MNIKTILTILVFGFCYLIFLAPIAYAQCQPIYGGGVSCPAPGNLQINKTVQNPQTSIFVDNLGVNDPKYNPDQNITFQVIVTNTGQTTLGSVNVRDIFPQFINFVSGPGNFDANNKTLSFDLANLQPNESRTFTLTGKVVPANQITIDQGNVCVVNQAIATSGSLTSQDNAQLCIQKQIPVAIGGPAPVIQQVVTVPGVTTVPAQVTKGGLQVFPPPQVAVTPPTGPEALSLLALIPSALAGFYLRKIAR